MSKFYSMVMGWLFILSLALGGCISRDKTIRSQPIAGIEPGSYQRINISGAAPEPIALNITGVEMDRGNRQAIFKLGDGDEIAVPWKNASASTWGEGCPTNSGSTRMEIVYLEGDELVLDGITFEHPVLVATCPSPPMVIVLREADGIGSHLPAVACDWSEGAKCVYFAQDYVTLEGLIVDAETQEAIPNAEIVFSSPAGRQSFSGVYHLSLPGGAVLDFTIHAPGFQDANGQIEISSDTVVFRFETGVYAGEPAQAYWIGDPDKPIEWNFSLAPESPLSQLGDDSEQG